jgi:DNA-binding MarR family transcriptional regulator
MAKTIEDEIQKIRISKMNDPEINLLILLDQVQSIVNNAIDLEIRHLRITRSQVAVLAMLSREDSPITLDEIAKWTLTKFNSVSTLINRMEKNGLVKKIRKDNDLKNYIVLTEKGSILYHKKVTENSIHLIFDKLTDEEKKHFESILKKIRNTTRDLLGLDFKPPFLP